MTPENSSLVKDATALVRESLHIKRAAGWADITGQLCKALEHSERVRELLEKRVQALESQLDRATFELSNMLAERAERTIVLEAAADETPDILTLILPKDPENASQS